ncbi:MAG: T9SS type A sorting domain-containing protein [Chitinophagales bacterium]
MKKLSFTLLIALFAFTGLKAQSFVQVIHNSPDTSVATLDVYINDSLYSELDNISFREATPFLTVASGVPIEIAIASDTSTSSAPAFDTLSLSPLMSGQSYILHATGVINTAVYPSNPDTISTAFQLIAAGGPSALPVPDSVDLLIAHGALDAPTLNVVVLETDQTLRTVVPNIPFKGFSSQGGNPAYVRLAADDGLVTLRDMSNNPIPGFMGQPRTFYAALSLLDEANGVVFASGFLDQSQSSAFGLYIATPLGDVIKIPEINSAAQFINNAADPATEEIDIYVVEQMTGNNGIIQYIDNLGFRKATPYTPFPSEVPLKIIAVPAGGTLADSLAVISDYSATGTAPNTLYSVIANGVLDPNDYTANPDGASIDFDLYVYDQARGQAQNSGEVDVLSFHGATDAPTIDIDIRELQGTEIEGLSYGEFSPNGYASFVAQNIILDVLEETTGDTITSHTATLSIAGGAAVTVFASGFVDDSQGETFGLFAALPINALGTGYVLQLPYYDPTFVSEVEVFNELSLYPNPSAEFLRVNYSLKESSAFEIRFVDAKGRLIEARDLGTVSTGNNYEEFNVSGLASGTYFMQMIIDNKGFVVKPVVVSNQ